MTLTEVLEIAKAKNPTLTEIDLSWQKIGSQGIKQLVQELPTCSDLNKLDLCGNNLGVEGVKELVKVLPLCSAINILNLSHNNLGPEGAKALASVLPTCSDLCVLGLTGNDLGVEGAKELASVLPLCNFLSNLDLEWNKLEAKGIKAIASVLSSCRSLSVLCLSGNDLGSEGAKALAEILPSCRSLSVLSVVANNIRVEGAKALMSVLPSCSTLSYLYLSSNKLNFEEDKINQTIESILKVNRQRYEAVMKFIDQGDIIQVKSICQQGVSLFAMSWGSSPYRGYTPLLLASSQGHLAIVQWLLENGCLDKQRILKTDEMVREDQGKNAIEIANIRGFKEIVALLQTLNVPEAKKETSLKITDQRQLKPDKSSQPALPEIKYTPQLQNSSPSMKLSSATTHDIDIKVNKICYLQLTYAERIGKGSLGVVYQGRYGFTDVAIKELFDQHLTEKSLTEFKNEATILGQLRHPNIVTFYGICLEFPHYSLVMELMPNHSLWDFLHTAQEISWEIRSNIALDIAAGLVFLHDQNILHRDLKSLNVLLDGHFRAKISDFSFAKLKSEISKKTNEEKEETVSALCWKAPELFELEAKYSKASDIYSFGMILWELAACKEPFAYAPDAFIIQLIKSGKKQAIPGDCPEVLAKVISQCWQTESQKRISASAALESLSIWKKDNEQTKFYNSKSDEYGKTKKSLYKKK